VGTGGLGTVPQRGAPLDASNVGHDFHRYVQRAGLPWVRFHDLRHTAATLHLVQGASPRLVMELLGHSQIAVTMNTYSHVLPTRRKKVASRMEAILMAEG
jgi:integrase